MSCLSESDSNVVYKSCAMYGSCSVLCDAMQRDAILFDAVVVRDMLRAKDSQSMNTWCIDESFPYRFAVNENKTVSATCGMCEKGNNAVGMRVKWENLLSPSPSGSSEKKVFYKPPLLELYICDGIFIHVRYTLRTYIFLSLYMNHGESKTNLARLKKIHRRKKHELNHSGNADYSEGVRENKHLVKYHHWFINIVYT